MSKRKRETHEDASAALGSRALTTETLDLAVRVDLVVLQDRHLDLLALVLDLLRGLYARSSAPAAAAGTAGRTL
jgi:hypothetical protein